MAYIGIGPASFTNNLTNVQILDDIKSQFNGSKQNFDLTSNDIPFQAVSDRALMVILGGVIQAPGVDYTINGDEITFTTAPVSGLTFYARNIYGLNALNGVNDGIVGPYSLTTGGPTWDTSGNTTISGNLTVQGATTTIQSTTLDVIDKDIKLASNQSTNAGIDTAGLLWGTTAVKLKYYNNGGTNPGLNIEGTNVGIGTTAPTEKLHVTGTIKVGPNDTATRSGSVKIGGAGVLSYSDNHGSSGNVATVVLENSYGAANSDIHVKQRGDFEVQNLAGHAILRVDTAWTNASVNSGSVYLNYKSGASGSSVETKLETTATGVEVTGTVTADDLIVTGTSVVADLKSTNNNNVLGIAGNNSSVKTYLGTDSSGNFLLATGSGVSTRLGIDAADGHITPGAAGTQDLGSATKEFRHLYLGDQGKAYFGLDQDMSMTFDSSNAAIELNTGNFSIIAYQNNKDVKILSDNGSGGIANYFVADGSTGEALLHHYGSQKFATSTTGITVTGEVAASQDYPTIRPALDLNFAAVKKLDPRITYYREGPASYTDESGKVVLVGDNVPRFDHDVATRECKGLLIEETRTNKVNYSQTLATGWSANNAATRGTRVTNDSLPDGSVGNLWEVVETTSNSMHLVYQQMTGSDSPNNTACTISAFAKPGLNRYHFVLTEGNTLSATACFNVQTGTVVSTQGTGSPTATISGPYGDGWYRCSLTYTTASTQNYINIQFGVGNNSGSVSYAGDGSSSIAVWGVQHELGSFATSFIPTHGVATTRGADLCQITGQEFSDFYNQTEGTIVTEHSIATGVAAGDNTYVYQIDDGSDTNVGWRLLDHNSAHGDLLRAYGFVGGSWGSPQYGFDSATPAHNTFLKVALGVKNNDFGVNFFGGTTATDTSGSISGNGDMTRLTIGNHHGGTAPLQGYIRRFIYYPQKLTTNQLKTITS